MAWTAPMTFYDGRPLTASQLNTHLRDNLLETATSKASAAGSYFVTNSPYSIQELTPLTAVNTANDTTNSSSYTDLNTTVGPSVTVETGDTALVIISSRCNLNVADGSARVSHDVSGATEVEPSDRHSIRIQGTSFIQASFVVLRTDLTPGENTFTMRYRATDGTANFQNRRIIVLPGLGF